MINIRTYMIMAAMGFAVMFSACDSQDETENKIDDALELENNAKEQKALKQAQDVFYSLPAPGETIAKFEKAGAKYNEEFLNPTSNVSKYTTTRSQAINLGVYSTDLTYVTVKHQQSASGLYLVATKKLAEELGLMDVVSQETMKRMEDNIENKDSLQAIMSEILMSSNSSLKEDGRAQVAAIILTGTWIEGLYLATKLAQSAEAKDELKELIIDHRISLKTINQLLESFDDSEDVKTLIEDLKEVTDIYNKVETTSGKTVVEKDENGKSIIKNSSVSTLADDEFDKLIIAIDQLRNKITNN